VNGRNSGIGPARDCLGRGRTLRRGPVAVIVPGGPATGTSINSAKAQGKERVVHLIAGSLWRQLAAAFCDCYSIGRRSLSGDEIVSR